MIPAWPQASPQAVWGPSQPLIIGQQSVLQATAPAKRSRRDWWLILLGLGLSLVLFLSGSGLVVWALNLPRPVLEASPLGYDIVARSTVDVSGAWTIGPIPCPLTDQPERSDGGLPGQLMVFADPQLTQPVSFAAVSLRPGPGACSARISVADGPMPAAETMIAQPEQPNSIRGLAQWPQGDYYVVSYRDRDQRPLDRPEVFVYTVDAQAASPDASAVGATDFTVDADGGDLTLNWQPVANARSYAIIRVGAPDQHGVPDYRVIGWTKTTSWSASTQDQGFEQAHQDRQPVVDILRQLRGVDPVSGDPCTLADVSSENQTPWQLPRLAVAALDQYGQTTAIQPLDIASALAGTAVEQAAPDVTLSDPPATTAALMANCQIGQLPAAAEWFIDQLDERVLRVGYRLDGSLLSTERQISDSSPEAAALIDQAASLGRPVLNQPSSSGDLNRLYPREISAIQDGATPSLTAPESPYQWNGSSDMVKYLAANLFAGQPVIDVGAFASQADAPLILDAAAEAWLQNPYITDSFPFFGVSGTSLIVDYEMTAQERSAEAAQVKTVVDQVTTDLITADMTDRDKALAINRYIASEASYDDAAAETSSQTMTRTELQAQFPSAWDAVGVLINHSGVCMSYALAFKALADAAGLESVVITGYADDSGIGHAWVKVKIDGGWQVIDPTWNSDYYHDGYSIDLFFGLTDFQADRRQFDSFIADDLILSYQTA
ncbi:MAG: hypothetical protein LBV30_06790 [Propionibacteriaceae bacterium]|jgi:hypothetical protein|nr:hypothetical protein [Propionibacteriaceae bacterium]